MISILRIPKRIRTHCALDVPRAPRHDRMARANDGGGRIGTSLGFGLCFCLSLCLGLSSRRVQIDAGAPAVATV